MHVHKLISRAGLCVYLHERYLDYNVIVHFVWRRSLGSSVSVNVRAQGLGRGSGLLVLVVLTPVFLVVSARYFVHFSAKV